MSSTSVSAKTNVGASEKFCVVCGAGSHRTDWVNKTTVSGKDFVACDQHTKEEFNKAITAASITTKTPSSSKPKDDQSEAKPSATVTSVVGKS
jgi:hypothetical protein